MPQRAQKIMMDWDIEAQLKKLGNFYHTGTAKVFKHKKTLKKYYWLSNEKYSEFLQRIFNDINNAQTGEKK
tara:strand:+ start:249 stop:461 length:213 start_codon:yes stop_codon:yes gene_type:complete